MPTGPSEVRLAAAECRPNDVVYFIGNPQVKNTFWDCAIGTTSAVEIKEWEFATGQAIRVEVVEVKTAAGLDSGFSGGPVLNGAGELVGITIAAREEKSHDIYCASASQVRQRLTQSYSTLALAALRRGETAAARALIATGRRLSPDDADLLCLGAAIAWLNGLTSPASPVLQCVGQVIRATTEGTLP